MTDLDVEWPCYPATKHRYCRVGKLDIDGFYSSVFTEHPTPPDSLDDGGRPPLPAETVAYDKGVMAGYLAAKKDYSPGGMYAMPVFAIEAEAVAAERARITREVKALLWQGQSDQDGAYNDGVRAVLAMLEAVTTPERRSLGGEAGNRPPPPPPPDKG